MNLIEKFHAIMVSDKIRIWHYPLKKEYPKFYMWLIEEEPENKVGHGYHTLEGLVEAAYKKIDPSLKEVPHLCPEPPTE